VAGERDLRGDRAGAAVQGEDVELAKSATVQITVLEAGVPLCC
jgi:hypothetical protein